MVRILGQVRFFAVILKCCKRECCKDISSNDQDALFDLFYESASKEQQYVLLSGLLQAQTPTTHVVGATRKREALWKYCVKVHGIAKNVCRKFFLDMYQISEKRLRVIQQKVLDGDTFKEKRGSHGNRPHKIAENVWDIVKIHLQTIPSRESHYSRDKSKKRYFENPNLSPKKLYDLFKGFYRERTGENLKNLHYTTYHKFFLHKMNYGFTIPRTDVCDFCSQCIVKLKSNPNDECKTSYNLHQRKYKSFKNLKDELLQQCKSDDSKVVKFYF